MIIYIYVCINIGRCIHAPPTKGLPNASENKMTLFNYKQHGTISCKKIFVHAIYICNDGGSSFYRWRACQRCIKQQTEVPWLAYLRFIVSIVVSSVSQFSIFNSYEFCFVLCKFSFVETNLFKTALRMRRFCGCRNFVLQVIYAKLI